ncbi:MAG: PAS domain-containing protein [Candidatus Hydrothermarchaeales archaeon]
MDESLVVILLNENLYNVLGLIAGLIGYIGIKNHLTTFKRESSEMKADFMSALVFFQYSFLFLIFEKTSRLTLNLFEELTAFEKASLEPFIPIFEHSLLLFWNFYLIYGIVMFFINDQYREKLIQWERKYFRFGLLTFSLILLLSYSYGYYNFNQRFGPWIGHAFLRFLILGFLVIPYLFLIFERTKARYFDFTSSPKLLWFLVIPAFLIIGGTLHFIAGQKQFALIVEIREYLKMFEQLFSITGIILLVLNFQGLTDYFIDKELIRTTKQLKESEKKFRNIFKNLTDIYYRTDLEGKVTLVNPAGVRAVGYDNINEVVGKNLAEEFYFNPEDRKDFIKELKKHGEVENYEVTLKRKDGAPLIVETNFHFIYDEAGKPIGVEGTARDITERKWAEKRYQTLFENSLDGIYRSTAEGKFIDVNPALMKMLGYESKEELLSVDIPKDLYLSEDDRPSKDERNTIRVNRIKRKNGTPIWVESGSRITLDDEGRVVYEGIVRDITEHKRMEEA